MEFKVKKIENLKIYRENEWKTHTNDTDNMTCEMIF